MPTFSEIIKSGRPVLVDFYAEWCAPCKSMSPVIKKIAGEFEGRARILKIDIDKNPKAAAHYHVNSVPTFMIFKSGKIVWRQSGALPASELVQMLNSFL